MKEKTLIKKFGFIDKCQICSASNLETILSLGHQPPVHAHIDTEGLKRPEIRYPLNLCLCNNCHLVQLDYIVDPKIVFPASYPYYTGMTNMLIRNFDQLAESLFVRHNLNKKDLVIDIGSNDGTLLQGFKKRGLQVLGIEPTNAAKVANKNGIITIQDYFTEKVASAVVKKYGQAKIITATNVFAHVNNLSELLAGIQKMLRPDGVFISESQYLMDVVEKLELDTIYHEHLRYYSLKPLINLFSMHGFTLIDAERISAAGGSIRVYAIKGKGAPSKRVSYIISEEEKLGLYEKKVLADFATRAKKAKHKLLKLLIDCKEKNKKIVGIGAPARSNTLLGYANIGKDILEYAVEKEGSPKIGLFTPGTHIPIVSEERLFKDQPEYALLLSWHIGNELMEKLKAKGYKGKFIMPLPEPKIISK